MTRKSKKYKPNKNKSTTKNKSSKIKKSKKSKKRHTKRKKFRSKVKKGGTTDEDKEPPSKKFKREIKYYNYTYNPSTNYSGLGFKDEDDIFKKRGEGVLTINNAAENIKTTIEGEWIKDPDSIGDEGIINGDIITRKFKDEKGIERYEGKARYMGNTVAIREKGILTRYENLDSNQELGPDREPYLPIKELLEFDFSKYPIRCNYYKTFYEYPAERKHNMISSIDVEFTFKKKMDKDIISSASVKLEKWVETEEMSGWADTKMKIPDFEKNIKEITKEDILNNKNNLDKLFKKLIEDIFEGKYLQHFEASDFFDLRENETTDPEHNPQNIWPQQDGNENVPPI